MPGVRPGRPSVLAAIDRAWHVHEPRTPGSSAGEPDGFDHGQSAGRGPATGDQWPGRPGRPARRDRPAGRDGAGRGRRGGPDRGRVGRPGDQGRHLESGRLRSGHRLRHARRAHHPPCGQPRRLAHAGRGRWPDVPRTRLGLRGDRDHHPPRDAPGAPGGRSAGRMRLHPGLRWPGRYAPPLPLRRAAIASLAPGRGSWPAGDLPDAGRVHGELTAGSPHGTWRHFADVPQPARRQAPGPGPVGVSPRDPQRAVAAGRGASGRRARVAGRPVPGRRPAAAAADEVASAGRRGDAGCPGGRSAGHRGRPGRQSGGICCLHGCADHRLVRDPGRDDDRDSPAPAVRHRRDHQPGGGLRAAVGGVHGRVRGHRAGHRHVRRAPRRPGAHGRRGGLHRVVVPAVAAPLPAVREPAGVRRAGHAVSGAV